MTWFGRTPGSIRSSKPAGAAISVAAYMQAFWLITAAGLLLSPNHPLAIVAVGDLAATITVFVFSVLFDNSSMYDREALLAITLMFVFISVPVMESRAPATRQGYADYRRRTRMLLPFRL